MRLKFLRAVEHDGAVSFSFEPLEPTKWIAGQSVRLEVPGFYGPEERRFTISSAPSEKVITITTRISPSSYKQALQQLVSGAEVEAYDIRGDFVWTEGSEPLVFIAGGIGVTPFRAMLAERAALSLPLDATLLHVSRRPYFASEFTQWQRQFPEFSYHFTLGRLDASAIADAAFGSKAMIYISGPSAAIDAVAVSLQTAYHVPSERIKRDWFTGRLSADD